MIFGVLFVAVKVWSNTSYGGSVFNGLRSGIVGLVVYSAALGVINMLSERSRLEMFGASRLGEREARLGLSTSKVLAMCLMDFICSLMPLQQFRKVSEIGVVILVVVESQDFVYCSFVGLIVE